MGSSLLFHFNSFNNEKKINNTKATQTNNQYSLAKILGIWLLTAVPIGLLVWVIFPALKDSVAMQPQISFFALNVIGLMCQVVYR